MTAHEDLITMIARLYEMAEFYSPPYAKPDVNACYSDILALIGALDEAQRITAAPGQLDLFAEGWPV
jgi:hypothetical protein